MKILLATLCLFSSLAVHAQGLADYERILLPLMSEPTPGGFGSLWTTDFWAYNDSNQGADFTVNGFGCQVTLCGGTLPPRTSSRVVPWRINSPTQAPGLLVYLIKSASNQVSFSLRIQDVSRQALTWGTEIPVIRESEFISSRMQLLNVPLDGRFRQTLRIYEVDAKELQVAVRIFGPTSAVPLAETVAQLTVPATGFSNEFVPGWHYRPAYSQLSSFRDMFPQLRDVETVRIEIEPLTPGMRMWAFAAITNNETQHVTTITPQ